MIDLYTFSTPNGRKASVMLEEVGLPYRVHVVDITKGDQFKPEFLAINPNNKIPAIVDPDGPGGKPLTLFESGAILIYLAEKTGKLLPKDPAARYHAIQWLMFQKGGVGPMFGQFSHFVKFAKEQVPYGIKRYGDEAKRLLGVIEKQVLANEYLAGPEYTIADVATYPWVVAMRSHDALFEPGSPGVDAWLKRVAARPAVVKGMSVP